MARRREPVFAGLNYDPDEAAVLLPAPEPEAKRKRRGKASKEPAPAVPAPTQEDEIGHGKGRAKSIHDHGALLDKTPLGPSELTKGFSQEAITQLNNCRKQRGMMEAEELGAALFWKIPDDYQRRILDLIRIMDNVSTGHPKIRNKLVRVIVDKFLEAARDSRRPTKK